MGGLECVITGLLDEFKDFFKRWHIGREALTGIVVFASFLVALSCVTPVRREDQSGSGVGDKYISAELRFI
jgi:hypothetical protein